MTFSLCVRERIDGGPAVRFGVGVTSRVPGVGIRIPHVSENAAVATQSVVNVDLGRRAVRYVDDGLRIGDAIGALLHADPDAASRQVHGVDRHDAFAHTGDDCDGWAGHTTGEAYTVAGNHLAGEAVIAETARAYRATDPTGTLAARLVEALAAGVEAGGDARTEMPIQSAAIRIATDRPNRRTPPWFDLRVDATETPIADLRSTLDRSRRGFEDFLEHVGEA